MRRVVEIPIVADRSLARPPSSSASRRDHPAAGGALDKTNLATFRRYSAGCYAGCSCRSDFDQVRLAVRLFRWCHGPPLRGRKRRCSSGWCRPRNGASRSSACARRRRGRSGNRGGASRSPTTRRVRQVERNLPRGDRHPACGERSSTSTQPKLVPGQGRATGSIGTLRFRGESAYRSDPEIRYAAARGTLPRNPVAVIAAGASSGFTPTGAALAQAP